MKELFSLPMRTSFDILSEGMKLELPCSHKGKLRATSCFMTVYNWLSRDGEDPHNKYVRYVKYYPWMSSEIIKAEPEYEQAVQAYLDVLFSIPFVKERVIEHTGYAHHKGHESSVVEGKYFLVDMKAPVDEGFSILQMLRIPQEFPGRIKTFYDTVKSTGCERTAFLAALLYENSCGTPSYGGHFPTNGLSVEWAQEFIKDPGTAKSCANKWNSDVMGGGSGKGGGLYYEDFIAHLSGGDPCTIPVAVYGSLRKGLGNHALLSSAIQDKAARYRFMWNSTVNCKMYSLGGFPALVPTPDLHRVTFEVYHVNQATLKRLDGLEGYPTFYDRTQIMINDNLCWVYFHHKAPSDEVVEHGDWVTYVQNTRRAM